jgi:hypothetical protein
MPLHTYILNAWRLETNPMQAHVYVTDALLLCGSRLLPRRPDRPSGAALRVPEAVAKATEEVNDGLEAR